jgi:hypothetical protein
VSTELHHESVARFVYGAVTRARGGDWSALVVPDEVRVEAVSVELQERVQQFTGRSVDRLGESEGGPPPLDALCGSMAPAVVVPVRAWSAEAWRALDGARPRLPVERMVVFVLSENSFKTMARVAPNLASFLDSSTSAYAPDEGILTDDERERRLGLLRHRTGRTDQEILELATAKQLPPDSAYAEWLLLLGRGDLL